MKLLFTHYVDSVPADVEANLGNAVSTGLDAANELVDDGRHETQTATIDRGLRVTQGLTALDGAEIRVGGTDQLATLEISVPWSEPDVGTAKLWAATRFASVVADAVRPAA
jgi:hypothetical protein